MRFAIRFTQEGFNLATRSRIVGKWDLLVSAVALDNPLRAGKLGFAVGLAQEKTNLVGVYTNVTQNKLLWLTAAGSSSGYCTRLQPCI